MIFVTVGAQMPFDRLVSAVDEWAFETDREDVFAQVGKTDWRPRKIECTPFLPPSEFRRYAERASVIVAHAGIGSIFTAMELGKPIIVMPRLASLHETRNEHQLATVKYLGCRGITAAMSVAELTYHLGHFRRLYKADMPAQYASPQLLTTIRCFVGSSSADANRNLPELTDSTAPNSRPSTRQGDC